MPDKRVLGKTLGALLGSPQASEPLPIVESNSTSFFDAGLAGLFGTQSALDRAIAMVGKPLREQLDNPFLGFGVGSVRVMGRSPGRKGDFFGADKKSRERANENFQPEELHNSAAVQQEMNLALKKADLSPLGHRGPVQLKTVSSPNNLSVVPTKDFRIFRLVDEKTGDAVADFKFNQITDLFSDTIIGGRFVRQFGDPGKGGMITIQRIYAPGNIRGSQFGRSTGKLKALPIPEGTAGGASFFAPKGAGYGDIARLVVDRVFRLADKFAQRDIELGDAARPEFFRQRVQVVK